MIDIHELKGADELPFKWSGNSTPYRAQQGGRALNQSPQLSS
jgi:hypothetical protein